MATTTLSWEYDDGGRCEAGFRPREVGDCVARVIAIGTGLPYVTVVDMVNAMGKDRGRRMYKTRPAALETADITDLLAGLGWTYTKLGHGVHLSPGELPAAPRVIADLSSHHVCAVIDGVIRDTWDSSRMRSQKPDAKTHNRHLVAGVWLPPACHPVWIVETSNSGLFETRRTSSTVSTSEDTTAAPIAAQEPPQAVTAVTVAPAAPAVTGETPVVVSETVETTTYRQAAITLWGEAGAHMHDCYDRWHHLYPELPDTVPIVAGITAYGHCIGATQCTWEHGPRITIHSNQFGRGKNVVADIMVHEMLHAWAHAPTANPPTTNQKPG